MWVLKWTNPVDGDFDVVVFTTQIEAAKQAASEVLSWIKSEWDMTILEQATEAKEVNDYVKSGDYVGAITSFNSSSTNSGSVDGRRYWSVLQAHEHATASSVPRILDPDFFTALIPDPNSTVVTAPATQKSPSVYQATQPGATCRGPRCGVKSEYAYADRPDGTYVCYQCKMMSSVFGGIQKP